MFIYLSISVSVVGPRRSQSVRPWRWKAFYPHTLESFYVDCVSGWVCMYRCLLWKITVATLGAKYAQSLFLGQWKAVHRHPPRRKHWKRRWDPFKLQPSQTVGHCDLYIKETIVRVAPFKSRCCCRLCFQKFSFFFETWIALIKPYWLLKPYWLTGRKDLKKIKLTYSKLK